MPKLSADGTRQGAAAKSAKAEKLTPAEQRRRFQELSRELGTDSGEALDAAFGKIVPPKLPVRKGQ